MKTKIEVGMFIQCLYNFKARGKIARVADKVENGGIKFFRIHFMHSGSWETFSQRYVEENFRTLEGHYLGVLPEVKIYSVGGSEFIAARSIEEAVKFFNEAFDEAIVEHEMEVVPDWQLDQLMFQGHDEDENPVRLTYAERLSKMIKDKHLFPCPFATIDR